MSQERRAQRIAESLIRSACRRLPADVCDERCREWAAELPAILDDQSIRQPFLRTLRALSFSIGISRTARHLSRSARAGSRRTRNSQRRNGALETQSPDMAIRVLVGLVVWLVSAFSAIALLRAHPDPHGWPVVLVLALAGGFDAFCLVDITRAARVRYLPKWAWALICLLQSPGGGIMYLSIGHIGRPRPVPPGDAKP